MSHDRTPVQVSSRAGDQTLWVSPDHHCQRLTDLLRRESLPLNTRCGQRGLCDGCLVEIHQGSLRHVLTNQAATANGAPVTVRACEYRLVAGSPTVIRLPDRSLLAYRPQVVSEFQLAISAAHAPLSQRIVLPPATNPNEPLLERLARALGPDHPHVPCLRLAPDVPAQDANAHRAEIAFRGDHWLMTATGGEDDTVRFGAAVDVGTTTVAAVLVDLDTGEIVARASSFNHQMHSGDDVLTRINLCMSDPAMLAQLQGEIVTQTVFPLLIELLDQVDAVATSLVCVSMTGNTTMLHLFAGVDPSPMGVMPFTPPFLNYQSLATAALPLPPHTPPDLRPTFHLLPGAAAYVGADLTAGVVATGMRYAPETALLVDVGTNGEIILKRGDEMFGCATAAGPAFEGARLTCGMRAGDGAISHIRLHENPLAVVFDMIGDAPKRAAGLCGSAYVDFLAEGRRVGLLNGAGRFNPEVAGDRLSERDGCGRAFRIAFGQGKEPIVISESDIASLLQAKAAIAAGILTLLRHAGLEIADVQTLHLAGGFGMHMSVPNAIACGLLPGFRAEQVRVVGNTALAGAYVAMLDASLIDELAYVGRTMRIVELNLEPDFESCFIDQLGLSAPDCLQNLE
ncbi:MAG: ASKHA domain-containing protein [Phycisphaeraceae bacterium]